jgi:hypothetical protein
MKHFLASLECRDREYCVVFPARHFRIVDGRVLVGGLGGGGGVGVGGVVGVKGNKPVLKMCQK